jgi:hypothetical protein
MPISIGEWPTCGHAITAGQPPAVKISPEAMDPGAPPAEPSASKQPATHASSAAAGLGEAVIVLREAAANLGEEADDDEILAAVAQVEERLEAQRTQHGNEAFQQARNASQSPALQTLKNLS